MRFHIKMEGLEFHFISFIWIATHRYNPVMAVLVHFIHTNILNKNKSTIYNTLNPRPAGPLDFPPPAGGGGAFKRPPMISAPGHRREKRKAAFESSRKIILKSFRSFFGSGQN